MIIRPCSSIAVVDDDQSVRDSLRSLIQSAGYECVVFPSAEVFLNFPHQSEIACLVLDVRMPGISGLELQLCLRRKRSRVPIIFVSGYVDDEMRATAISRAPLHSWENRSPMMLCLALLS